MHGSGSYYRLGQVSANEDNAYKRLLEALVKDCTECQTSCTKKDCGKPYECNNKTERALTKFEKKLDPKELERRSKIQAKSLEGQQRRAAKKAGTYSRTPKNRTETHINLNDQSLNLEDDQSLNLEDDQSLNLEHVNPSL
jgi:hypothetical protein